MKAFGDLSHLPASSQKLISEATRLIKKRATKNLHHVASALLTDNDEVYIGLHIASKIGVAHLCAERVAIALSQLEHNSRIIEIVAVRSNFDEIPRFEIVPPCGHCRQFILQYGGDAMVLVSDGGTVKRFPIRELLPFPFVRN